MSSRASITRIIYIPGLGDHFTWLRRLALTRWRSPSVAVTLVPMRWANRHETYEQKYQRIADEIARYPDEQIVLVGESAGGAMAIYAYSQLCSRIHQVITICGYNHGASAVHPMYRMTRPAFYQLMPAADRAVAQLSSNDLTKLTIYYSTRDSVVHAAHTVVKGARIEAIHVAGHLSSIGYLLISRLPLRLIEKG